MYANLGIYRILSGKREAVGGSWLWRRFARRVCTGWLLLGKYRRATAVVARWPREPHAVIVGGRRRRERRVEGDGRCIVFGGECRICG